MPVQGAQDRRRIRRAAAHARADRDTLVKRDGHALALLADRAQVLQGRADGEVALIPGNEVEVRFGLDTARVVKVDAHIVTEGDGLHDHGHIVVAVGAPFGRVEGDVELGVSLFVYGGQDMYLRIF